MNSSLCKNTQSQMSVWQLKLRPYKTIQRDSDIKKYNNSNRVASDELWTCKYQVKIQQKCCSGSLTAKNNWGYTAKSICQSNKGCNEDFSGIVAKKVVKWWIGFRVFLDCFCIKEIKTFHVLLFIWGFVCPVSGPQKDQMIYNPFSYTKFKSVLIPEHLSEKTIVDLHSCE